LVDVDDDLGFVGQLLQFDLPEPNVGAILAAVMR